MTPDHVHRRAVPVLNYLDPNAHWIPSWGLDGLWRYWAWRRTWSASGAPGWARVGQVTFDAQGCFVRL